MQLTTPVTITKSDFQITYDSEILSLGSCFAVNMAEKFTHFGFRSTVNPLGILFHPIALEKLVRFAVEGKRFSEADIFFHNERWQCFDAHSETSQRNKPELLNDLNESVATAARSIKSATHIVITLGTAWAYRFKESGALVANCHKVSNSSFSKELLSVGEIETSIASIIELIAKVNPLARIIWTVSPVRHIKDGLVENRRSKSNLISALHSAIENAANSHYFASYEILMDELRDYRFYAPDMIHPSSVAIDFIWEKFRNAWIADSEFELMNEVDAVRKAIAHRPFNPDSEQHQKFMLSVSNRIAELRNRLPHIVLE